MPTTPDLGSPDLREASETYARVIYTEDHHRLALCKDGVQYLIQRRLNRTRGPEWKSMRYCATGRAAARDWRHTAGTDLPTQMLPLADAREATKRLQ